MEHFCPTVYVEEFILKVACTNSQNLSVFFQLKFSWVDLKHPTKAKQVEYQRKWPQVSN
jgi:hypothetical protein